MNKDESLALYAQGREAWNAWAAERRAEREALKAAGNWVEPDSGRNLNDATRDWHAAAADFSEHTFEAPVDFASFDFPGEARFVGATFRGYTTFDWATFSSSAWFDGATFSGKIKGVRLD